MLTSYTINGISSQNNALAWTKYNVDTGWHSINAMGTLNNLTNCFLDVIVDILLILLQVKIMSLFEQNITYIDQHLIDTIGTLNNLANCCVFNNINDVGCKINISDFWLWYKSDNGQILNIVSK